MPNALLAIAAVLAVASAGPDDVTPAAPSAEPGIQDNSFLMEEAYNQEWGVVQHISAFSRSLDGQGWTFTFTQEWPLRGIKHQLSFSLPVQDPGNGAGVGDVALNYRYQLAGDGEARLACAPRFSVLVPSGSERMGRGAGGVGLQVNVPLSLVLARRLVTHLNAGFTLTPSAKSPSGDEARTTAYNLGHSLVWLASARVNLLVETVWSRAEFVAGPGATDRGDSLFVSPGVRWAYNFPSGLQIVPGVAFPLGIGPSSGAKSLFLYLSFEHPFERK